MPTLSPQRTNVGGAEPQPNLTARSGEGSPLDAGERAYAYAKACGIIGKSFVGKRVSALAKLNALNEFGRLVFPETSQELPGRELLIVLERRLLSRTIRHIAALLNSYSNPPELLVRQLRSCEYADLKTCLRHIVADKPIPANLSDLGKFGTVRFNAYPDLKAMLKGTEFEFILSKDLKDTELTALEAEIDLQYYTLLMKSLQSLPAEDRLFAQRILAEEISLRNCIWALRLRTYFDKTSDETRNYLMRLVIPQCPPTEIPGDIQPRFSTQKGKYSDTFSLSLSQEAEESLFFQLDNRSAWQGWRWESLLNPDVHGENWAADPRYFQNAASRYIYRLSLRCFRRMPFSVNAGFCFIKLKQFEEDLLTSVAEGLGLGMGGNDVFNMLEVPA